MARDGVLVVDKPAGWTSHDVVARVRRLAGTRRVGHAGTLDPMATGVLVVGVERATRLLTYVVGADKEYLATVRLGAATTTDDAEGAVLTRVDASAVTAADVGAAIEPLRGDIAQVPSAVSAIKVDGRRAYARVRAGETVELAARPVRVSAFEVLALRPGVVDDLAVLDVDVRVECSSGTYVRALARDLGAALGVGGHLTALRRTRVAGFGLADAHALEGFVPGGDLPLLDPARAAAAVLPVRSLDAAEAVELSHGRRVSPGRGGNDGGELAQPDDGVVAAVGPDGVLVAVVRVGDGRPVLVMTPAG